MRVRATKDNIHTAQTLFIRVPDRGPMFYTRDTPDEDFHAAEWTYSERALLAYGWPVYIIEVFHVE